MSETDLLERVEVREIPEIPPGREPSPVPGVSAEHWMKISDRGVSVEVASYADPGRRPRYVSCYDYETWSRYWPNPGAIHKWWLEQSAGIIVNRWDLAGNPLPCYFRPDTKIQTDRGDPKLSKYIYSSLTATQPEGESGKLIDVHPMARELLLAEKTPTIYVAAEGCFNSDALLSKGKAAVSVSSVWMWPKTREEYRERVAWYRKRAETARTNHRVAKTQRDAKKVVHINARPTSRSLALSLDVLIEHAASLFRKDDCLARALGVPYSTSRTSTPSRCRPWNIRAEFFRFRPAAT